MTNPGFSLHISMILMVLLACLGNSPASAIASAIVEESQILHVKPGAAGDCLSWSSACELQAALGAALAGDQIWAAAGIYKPTTTTDRSLSFALKSGVEVYGGFPAAGGDWGTRDWQVNETVLNGDIGSTGQAADNSYHVVKANAVNAAGILDGFTISGGNADWAENEDDGGGMDNRDGSPTLRNLVFINNYAVNGGGLHLRNCNSTVSHVTFTGNTGSDGGGLHIRDSSPTLVNLSFENNTAVAGGGLFVRESSGAFSNMDFTANTATEYGGGMFISRSGSSLTITDVSLAGNSSGYVGGGMVNNLSNPVLTNVTFSSNNAVSFGGGLDNYGSSPRMVNVTFSGNSAVTGGGLFNTEGSNPTLANITFSANSANDGGGMYNWNSNPVLVNSILWGNTPNQITSGGTGSTGITYSDIQGGYAGTGNINLDPLLVTLADNGGFTLTHALPVDSPAIDSATLAACPPADQRHYPRPYDGDGDLQAECDMGSFEYGPPLFPVYLPAVLR